MTDTFPPTARTTASRDRDRVSYQRATANAIIDEAYVCHLGFTVDAGNSVSESSDVAGRGISESSDVAGRGISESSDVAGRGISEPRILPTLHVRIGDTLYLHGSTGSRPLLAARTPAKARDSASAPQDGTADRVQGGLPVCVTITHLDGIVFARSQFNHSANYRSVVAHGRARLVTDEAEKLRVLTALVEKIASGRSADSRPPTRRELAETSVLALPLTEVSVKARTGGAIDEPEDLDLPHWAGVVPLRLKAGPAEPEPGVTAPVPSYLQRERSSWLTAVAMRGDHVILEPLSMSHVEGLFAAIANAEVFRWMSRACPTTVDEMAAIVAEALRMYGQGQRIPFVQRSAETSAVIGTTSFYVPDEVNRSIAIGYTMLGRSSWRTGVNTEAKLLLLRRAFDELGAVRVEWHTDVLNERSQRAIARLGAVREGVHRRHRLRPDGSWRDTVVYSMTDAEWPEARSRLEERLHRAAPAAALE